MYYANEDLSAEFNQALRTLDTYELTEDEQADLASYVEAFNGAQKMKMCIRDSFSSGIGLRRPKSVET